MLTMWYIILLIQHRIALSIELRMAICLQNCEWPGDNKTQTKIMNAICTYLITIFDRYDIQITNRISYCFTRSVRTKVSPIEIIALSSGHWRHSHIVEAGTYSYEPERNMSRTHRAPTGCQHENNVL